MDARVKEISDRLTAMVDERDPLAEFVLSFFKTMLDQWKAFAVKPEVPPPFKDSPLVELVESMLPTVETQDENSSAMIRVLLDKARVTRDAGEKRTLGFALEWFYLYFNKETDLEFESWLSMREHERSH